MKTSILENIEGSILNHKFFNHFVALDELYLPWKNGSFEIKSTCYHRDRMMLFLGEIYCEKVDEVPYSIH
jgi:hypothetical protein